MARINEIIPVQNYESIRDVIGAIIMEELTNQGVLNPDYVVPTVWVERMVQFADAEFPAVNVCFLNAEYERKSLRSTHGTYTFAIDIFNWEPSTDTEQGDKISQLYTQNTAGKIRTILSSGVYNTLSLANGIIEGTEVKILKSRQRYLDNDTSNTTFTTLIFIVKAVENAMLQQGVEATMSTFGLTIDITANGMKFVYPQT